MYVTTITEKDRPWVWKRVRSVLEKTLKGEKGRGKGYNCFIISKIKNNKEVAWGAIEKNTNIHVHIHTDSYTSAHTEIHTHICYKHHNLKTTTWRELPLVWGYFSVWTTLVPETFDASLNVQVWEPILISHISFAQTLVKAEALHLFVSSVRTSVFLHSVMFWKENRMLSSHLCFPHT